MKEVGDAGGVAGVALTGGLTGGIGLQHSAPFPRGTILPLGRKFNQLQRASRIACAWLGLAEAVGFRAPPPVGARDFSSSSIAWHAEKRPAPNQSPAELLSAPIPPTPNRRLSVATASNPEFGSIPVPPDNNPTSHDDQTPLEASAAGPVLPLDFSIRTHPDQPDLGGHPDHLSINTTATHPDLSAPAGRGPNLFREITIRPAPSAIIANPALAEIARFSDARRSGPLTYVFRLTQSAIHDSNVAASATNRRSDLQLSVGPALLAQLGNEETRWRIGGAYIGAFSDFVNRSAQQTFDHLGTLSVNSNTNRIRFSLQASAQRLTSSFPDIGERVTRTTLYGAGTMVCKWGEKLSSELNADFTDSTFDRFLSSKEYRIQSLHVYEFSPKTRIGIGSAAGKLVASIGNEQLYVQG